MYLKCAPIELDQSEAQANRFTKFYFYMYFRHIDVHIKQTNYNSIKYFCLPLLLAMCRMLYSCQCAEILLFSDFCAVSKHKDSLISERMAKLDELFDQK